jgi:HD-GYP domain-containing protein (c-di-GMP phosphodiesterase class II)
MNDISSRASNLIAISIDFLYDGMEIQEDIYDAYAERMLIKRGSILTPERIRSIKRHNNGNSIIYVSGDTYRSLLAKGSPVETHSQWELEETTGYSAIKEETLSLLDNISQKKTVKKEALQSVSVELSERLESTSPSTIFSLINALAPVDEYLQRHCVNVSLINGLLGRWLGLSKDVIDNLVLIGLLHDCGKALIPHKVLNAPRKLTVVEFEVIKMHSVHSYNLLGDFPETVRNAVRSHHEKVSGSGYPDGLSRDNIPLEARITAISDMYDALVSQRSYKQPKSPFSIMEMLSKLSISDLDGRLVNVFNMNMPKELIDKAVQLNDGRVGLVRSIDPENVEFPEIEVNGRVIKTSEYCYCTSMFNEE